MTVLSWHNDPQLKTLAVQRMRDHRAAQRFSQGDYVHRTNGDWRGCFHGCLTAETLATEQDIPVHQLKALDIDWWTQGERIWGLPRSFNELLDDHFESRFTENDDAADWAVEVTEAIPVGVDLKPLVDRWIDQRVEPTNRQIIDDIRALEPSTKDVV